MLRQGQRTFNHIQTFSKWNKFSSIPQYSFSTQAKKDELTFFERFDPKKNKDLAIKLRILQYIKPYILPFYHKDSKI